MARKKHDEFRSVSDFVQNAESIIQNLDRNGKRILITQNGQTTAILLNYGEYERLIELLEFQRAIVAGKEDIVQGKSTSHLQLLKEAEDWIGE